LAFPIFQLQFQLQNGFEGLIVGLEAAAGVAAVAAMA
jgi:hypothetical protein